MNCMKCGSANPQGKRFCGDCGTLLPVRCGDCGSENPPGKRFCGDCGAALLLPGPASAGEDRPILPLPDSGAERRQLTVLFCDLVGSTALSTRVDPEDLREIIAAYHKCAGEIVARFEGFVANYMGDGVLAYFGYPQAHEDDAERAIRAGLVLAEAVGRLPIIEKLHARVGIATGLVVVGDLIGSADNRRVVGETLNLAARLQTLAAPDSVVIAASTRLLSGGLFDYEDLGSVEAKGFSEPVRVWRVLGERRLESRFEALHSAALTPLVGREEELALLLRRWERAKVAEGQVVLLSGEPGIGKSRLTVALQEKIHGERHFRLRLFCTPHHRESALFPFITQLERAAELGRDDTPQTKLDKLVRLLDTTPPHEDIAVLAELLSIPANDHYRPINLAPQPKKERTFAALFNQLENVARQKPVLMIFEDAHWSDPTSCDLLDLMVDRIQRLPALLIVTFRPDFQAPWIGQAHVSTMVLSRLNHREGATLVERISGDKALPVDVLEEIITRADGVPLFVEELTKALLDVADASEAMTGATQQVPRRKYLVPSTLHASFMARLDRLGPTSKEVAQVGSAIGREFSFELLAQIASFPNEEQLRDALRQLAIAGLIIQRGQPPHSSYMFKHALLQDAAYGSLTRPKRQHIHSAVKTVLERSVPEVVEAQPELLAFHCSEAGLVSEAITYSERAGRRAAQRSANREAAGHFRNALQLLKQTPEGAERDDRELQLLNALGPALMATMSSSAPDVVNTYARAGELARRTGRSAQLFPTIWGAHLVAAVAGDYSSADRLTDELFAIARTVNDDGLLLQAHHASFTGLKAGGDLMAAQQQAEAVMALYNPERHGDHALIYGAHDPACCAEMGIALTLLLRGFAEQSQRHAEQARRHAESLSHPPSLAHALRLAGELHQLRREPDAASEVAAGLLPLTIEHGSAVGRANAMMLRGWARVLQGERAEGLEDVREGLHLWRRTGSRYYASYRLGVAADAFAAANEHEEALQLVEEAFGAVEGVGDSWFKAELYRLRGALLLAWRHDEAEAESCFKQAVTIASTQSARLLEIRAAVGLARLWRGLSRCDEASKILSSIYQGFTEGFATQDMRDAKSLLDELCSWKG
jgi:class 3 adenylate cyclase/predicted ATPase/DNA polymerase III delta prime subunit